jgi:hypothetical protein
MAINLGRKREKSSADDKDMHSPTFPRAMFLAAQWARDGQTGCGHESSTQLKTRRDADCKAMSQRSEDARKPVYSQEVPGYPITATARRLPTYVRYGSEADMLTGGSAVPYSWRPDA